MMILVLVLVLLFVCPDAIDVGSKRPLPSLTRALKALERKKAPLAEAVELWVDFEANGYHPFTKTDARMLLYLARRKVYPNPSHLVAVQKTASIICHQLDKRSIEGFDPSVINMFLELICNEIPHHGMPILNVESVMNSIPPSVMDERSIGLLIQHFGSAGNLNVAAAQRAFDMRLLVQKRDSRTDTGADTAGSRENPIIWNLFLAVLLAAQRQRHNVPLTQQLLTGDHLCVPSLYITPLYIH